MLDEDEWSIEDCSEEVKIGEDVEEAEAIFKKTNKGLMPSPH